MIDNQFYPTPLSLALKARTKFKSDVVRLLEPSAGRGDLLAPLLAGYNRGAKIDCIESDADNLAVLRDKKLNVIGHDFLTYAGGAMYSHILMNPPFEQGAEHVLHAWKIMFDGEIVAIINAETLKNPYTRQRQTLTKLIADHGEVEYLPGEFVTPETQRKTAVEVALVYLRKQSEFKATFIDALSIDKPASEHEKDAVNLDLKEMAIPTNMIQNLVIEFNLAAKALKQAAMYRARASHYLARFDRSIVDSSYNGSDLLGSTTTYFSDGYDKLKERAWSTILRSTNVTDKLSSGQQKAVEAQFTEISRLEFTVQNIYGFLDGIISQQATLQMGMLCEVFDMISKYHPQNRSWFCGWKSNARHRVNAFKVMHTRFILPRCSMSYHASFSWDDEKRFSDFDKVFAMLDGKDAEAIYSLEAMAKEKYKELRSGERVTSDYFDLRYFPQAGTLHFFPTRIDLIDRLNRLVGKHRQWLPMDENKTGNAEFWAQYDKAEAINKRMDLKGLAEWRIHNGDETEKARIGAALREQYEGALADLKINYDMDSALPPSGTPVALPKLESAA